MKSLKSLIIFILLLISVSCKPEKELNWKIADNPILTEWAFNVDPLKPWPEYPRPDLVRNKWINLNGLWQYAITPKDARPEKWDGEILVPYPVESALSGVKSRVSENENLWYRTTFKIPSPWKKKTIILNFEACDWETTVWIDGKEAGKHKGGYDPFSFDITDLLEDKKEHEMTVCVWDPTDKSWQPRGKQVSNPGGIWYTPTTGIWQTVWIEPVSKSHIRSFRVVSDIEKGTLSFNVSVADPEETSLEIVVKSEGKKVAAATGSPDRDIVLTVDNPVLWSPDNPFLYDVTIRLIKNSRTEDVINSYAGFRRIALGKTHDGYTRILLNNEFVWQNGPLDQGFWPDGIYTPPTDEAMVYDIKMTKQMGFNMLRKHVKVENRRFYYWCDKLGILVWQDMPSGDKYISGSMPDISKSPEAVAQFEFELKNLIDTKYNHPSIIMWVPFNEGWGQFETERITSLISYYDPTRLVNSASGWTDRGTGDVRDVHHYPDPIVPQAEEKRAIVLGEFGGLGLPVNGHTWEQRNWGYRNMEDSVQLLSRYEMYYNLVHRFVEENGLSASVYTQTTDVETETNGLMTYDRKINKMGVENVFRANSNIIPPALKSPYRIFTDTFRVELYNRRPGGKVFYTLDGNEPDTNSIEYTKPLFLTASTVIKAFTKWNEGKSRTAEFSIEKKDLLPSVEIPGAKKGIKVSVFEGRFTSLPDFADLTPVKTNIVTSVDHKQSGKSTLFALAFDGYLRVPADGVYGLFIISDDGSRMIIDNTDPVQNDGIHGMREEGRYYPLAKGYHRLRIEYFQQEGGIGLEFRVESPGKPSETVPADWLYH